MSAALGAKQLNGLPAATTDVLSIGSISKQLTADLVSILIAKRQLDPMASVASIFPEVRVAGMPACLGASILQVMRHRAGFPRDHIPWIVNPDAAEDRKKWRLEQLISFAGVVKLDSRGYAAPNRGTQPGQREEYSNFGYSVLGAIAERVTGIELETLFRQLIFTPFGLATASFGLPNPGGKDSKLPIGHDAKTGQTNWVPIANWLDNAEMRSMVAAAGGGIRTTISDLARYCTIRCIWPTTKELPYPADIMRQLWMIDDNVHSISGAIGGYRSWWRSDRSRQLAVTYIANANMNGDQCRELETYLASL